MEINRDLVALFYRGFTRIDWQQHQALRRKQLAQWLQLYYSSHAKPLDVSLEFLRDISGSSTKPIAKFKQMVKAALAELQKVGAINRWRITEDGKIHVERTPSLSLQRYLSKA